MLTLEFVSGKGRLAATANALEKRFSIWMRRREGDADSDNKACATVVTAQASGQNPVVWVVGYAQAKDPALSQQISASRRSCCAVCVEANFPFPDALRKRAVEAWGDTPFLELPPEEENAADWDAFFTDLLQHCGLPMRAPEQAVKEEEPPAPQAVAEPPPAPPQADEDPPASDEEEETPTRGNESGDESDDEADNEEEGADIPPTGENILANIDVIKLAAMLGFPIADICQQVEKSIAEEDKVDMTAEADDLLSLEQLCDTLKARFRNIERGHRHYYACVLMLLSDNYRKQGADMSMLYATALIFLQNAPSHFDPLRDMLKVMAAVNMTEKEWRHKMRTEITRAYSTASSRSSTVLDAIVLRRTIEVVSEPDKKDVYAAAFFKMMRRLGSDALDMLGAKAFQALYEGRKKMEGIL